MSTDTLPALPTNGARDLAVPMPTGVAAVRETMETLKAIRTFIQEELKEGLDFGVIPGTQKRTLYKPGAEKAVMFFNAAPRYRTERCEMGNGHVEFIVTTRLIHRGTDKTIGSGLGSCSTMEKKYRYRGGARKCPHCNAEAISRSKQEYGGGFYCAAPKGGCGTKFRANDPSITSQEEKPSENPDIYDVRNTVLKMALKRSLVSAALGLGCLSELFTQDIEDIYDIESPPEERPAPPALDPRKKENRPQNNSGTKTGQYAPPEQTQAYLKALKAFLEAANARWIDSWTNRNGEIERNLVTGPIVWREPLNIHQADGHLLKWCVDQGHLDRRIVPEDAKARQLGAYVAIVYHRSESLRAELVKEMNAYARQTFANITAAIYTRHPELRPAEDESQEVGPEPDALPREPGCDDDK